MIDNSQYDIKEALVLTTRMDLRDVIRRELKAMQFKDVKMFWDKLEFLQSLKDNPGKLYIIHADENDKTIRDVFEIVKAENLVEFGPYILIARVANNLVVGLGLEFEVARVIQGDLVPDDFRAEIADVLDGESEQMSLRAIMSNIREARDDENWDKSRQILEACSNSNPDNLRIRIELALNLYHQELYTETMNLIEKDAKSEKGNPRIKHLYARCALKCDPPKFEEALDVMQEANLINPYNVDRLIHIGDTLLNLNRYSEAKGSFEQAHELDPDSSGAIAGNGKCLLLTGDVNEGIALLKGAMNLKEMISVFNTAAIFSIKKKCHDKAMNLYDKALELAEDNKILKSKIHFNKSLGYRRSNKIDEAVDQLKESIKEDPNYEKAIRNYRSLIAEHNIEIDLDIQEYIKTSDILEDVENNDIQVESEEPNEDANKDPKE